MENRCGFCFHPLGPADAACRVCGGAPTTTNPFRSTFGKPDPAPADPFSFSLAPTRREPANATWFGQTVTPAIASSSTFGFSTPEPSSGQAPPPATPRVFSFPPTPSEPANASSFGQTSPPATASRSPFGFSTPEHWLRQPTPPATPSPFGFSPTPPRPSNARSFGRVPMTPAIPVFGPMPPPPGSATERRVFDDDEPVANRTAAATTLHGVQEASTSNGPLVLNTHCEVPAVARGCARDSFAVLVHAKAPGAANDQTASLDLITVLDVSSSMEGGKLALLKEAMGFVIDKLGPADRLSVVSFSDQARRVTPLTSMSDAGKTSAKLAVESLSARGCTDILKGLDTAAKVLDSRRYRNTVASVILLSDGQDNCNSYQKGANGSYDYLVPRSLAGRNDGNRSTPVHTFGFGTDHDAKAMDAVAEATGGTYSFIENQAVVQDAFAQCIGGLLSVAVQEAWIAVACPHPDVRVRSIKSGRYESHVVAYGHAASVDVGELYADEERRFLLFVDVPRVAETEDTTRLIRVSCTYKDTATGKSAEVAGEDAVVRRPVEVTSEEDKKPSMEVQVERFRVDATEDIAAARAAAERGDHAEAARILDKRREAAGTGDLAGDARVAALLYELAELSARVSTRREYEQTGRPSLLSGMSSHAQQRASSVNFFGCMAPSAFGSSSTPAFGSAPSFGASSTPAFGAAFATPAMKDMVDSSRKIREEREQQQQQYSSATSTMPSIFARKN